MVADSALHHGNTQIFFGATVTDVDEGGVEHTVKIVGIDETIGAAGEVSWISPIARTLLKAFKGEVLKLVTPGRVDELRCCG